MFGLFRKKLPARICGGCLHADNKLWLLDDNGGFEIDARDDKQWQQAAAKLGPAQLQLALSASHYQLVAIDRPAVADHELPQALPFLVRDLVNVPVPRMQLDYFQLAANPADKDPLQVVVSDRQPLAKLANKAKQHGFELSLISIEELLLLELLGSGDRPQMLLWLLPEQPLKVLLAVDGKLLFSRNIRGFNQLDTLTALELEAGLFDALQLELQRSMDYLERQLRQPPVEQIWLLVPSQHRQLLADKLQHGLGVPAKPLGEAQHSAVQMLAHGAALARGHHENTN
ncbi:hypothetical protein [Ferrimonas senticii]|uniref:hypothetical protein n=1 Tax=Ferrimonas senticii TaxID=394566 RepID=UPI00041865F6|nr:hypothetical protein [Ferrimonas senticii]